jgi:hypothetical protein
MANPAVASDGPPTARWAGSTGGGDGVAGGGTGGFAAGHGAYGAAAARVGGTTATADNPRIALIVAAVTRTLLTLTYGNPQQGWRSSIGERRHGDHKETAPSTPAASLAGSVTGVAAEAGEDNGCCDGSWRSGEDGDVVDLVAGCASQVSARLPYEMNRLLVWGNGFWLVG